MISIDKHIEYLFPHLLVTLLKLHPINILDLTKLAVVIVANVAEVLETEWRAPTALKVYWQDTGKFLLK